MGFIKETFSEKGGGGSAKRITAFWFTVILITGLHLVFAWISYVECEAKIEQIMPFLLEILWVDLVFVGFLLGLCTIENLTDLYRIFKGVPKKPEGYEAISKE